MAWKFQSWEFRLETLGSKIHDLKIQDWKIHTPKICSPKSKGPKISSSKIHRTKKSWMNMKNLCLQQIHTNLQIEWRMKNPAGTNLQNRMDKTKNPDRESKLKRTTCKEAAAQAQDKGLKRIWNSAAQSKNCDLDELRTYQTLTLKNNCWYD